MEKKVFVVVENGELVLAATDDISDVMDNAVDSGQLTGEVYHEAVSYDSESDSEVTTSFGHTISCIDIEDKLSANAISDWQDADWDEEEMEDVDWDEEEWDEDDTDDSDYSEDDEDYTGDSGEELFTDEDLSDEGIEVDFDNLVDNDEGVELDLSDLDEEK